MRAFGLPLAEIAQPLDGPWADGVRAIAARHDVVVVVGMFTPAPDGRVTNTLLVTGPGVEARTTRSTSTTRSATPSRTRWRPGDDVVVVRVDGIGVGLATCYDVRFPDLFTALADRGAEVVCLPSSWGAGPGKVEQWQLLTRARALDSTCFVVATGQADPLTAGVLLPGRGAAPTGIGHSCVVGPDGTVLAELGAEPDLVVDRARPRRGGPRPRRAAGPGEPAPRPRVETAGVRTVVYAETGGPEVLRLADEPVPEPGPGELRVRVHRSGVNPTDWKSRAAAVRAARWTRRRSPARTARASSRPSATGCPASWLGLDVWVFEAAFKRRWGTASEHTLVRQTHLARCPTGPTTTSAPPWHPVHHRAPVPDGQRGGSAAARAGDAAGPYRPGLGRCGRGRQRRHPARPLVRRHDRHHRQQPAKGRLAAAAGATTSSTTGAGRAAEVRKIVPGGVDVVVEVNPQANAGLDASCSRRTRPSRRTPTTAAVPRWRSRCGRRWCRNVRWQFVLVYTCPPPRRRARWTTSARRWWTGRWGRRGARSAAAPLHPRAGRRGAGGGRAGCRGQGADHALTRPADRRW